jgi:hypothetical protein
MLINWVANNLIKIRTDEIAKTKSDSHERQYQAIQIKHDMVNFKTHKQRSAITNR